MSQFRVATAYSFDRTIERLQQRQTELAAQQERLSSGKRVQRVSDDPAAAALAEREQARMQRVQTDQRALEAARRNLELAESTLASINDLYHRAKELIVQGGNGALNESDRKTIADELEGIRERILALANTKDTLGRPLFMGQGMTNSLARPFVESLQSPQATTYGPDGRVVSAEFLRGQESATENTVPIIIDGFPVFSGRVAASAIVQAVGGVGDATAISAEIVDQSALDTTNVFTLNDAPVGQGYYVITFNSGTWSVQETTAKALPLQSTSPVVVTTVNGVTQLEFDGLRVRIEGTPTDPSQFEVRPAVDENVWETFDRAIGALNGESGYDLTQELAAVHHQLDTRLDRLLSARGQLGDWLNRADSMQAAFQERENYHIEQQSRLTDLDMLEAISRFQTLQLGYQAGLSSYAQVQRLSLFQYLA